MAETIQFDKGRHERNGWQYRAIDACKGNTTVAGMILIATLDKSWRLNGQRLGRRAVVDEFGNILAPYQSYSGMLYENYYVCQVSDMVNGFRKLADKLKLSDADREAMFLKLRTWIAEDKRSEELKGQF